MAESIKTKKIITTSETFIQAVVDCIANAVNDDILEEKKANHYVTSNGDPGRTWDFINRNVYKESVSGEIIANPTRRGPWEIVPIFEKVTGNLHVIMREERFLQVRKERPKRRMVHYVDVLAKALNGNLRSECDGQISLFSLPPFSNEDKIPEILDKILEDLRVPGNIVKHHALILFRAKYHQLISVRCCVIDSNLNIVEQADWSDYIRVDGGVIPEKADKTNPENDPSAGLNLKQKAKDRIGRKDDIKKKNEDEEKNN